MRRTLLRNASLLRQPPKRFFNLHSVQGPTHEEVRVVRKELYEGLIRDPNLSNVSQIPEINNPVVQAKRSALFSAEKETQLKEIGRIEKINVEYEGLPKNGTYLMNKYTSTPYQCAMHINDVTAKNAAVAEVNGQIWDMHRPLEQNCTLKLHTMKSRDEILFQVNRTFWRSCSMMLGYVLEKAFRDQIYVELHSFPAPNVRSGSFFYDADIKIPNWTPNSDEMRVFSAEMIKLSRQDLPFERLVVKKEKALEIFADNKYKVSQIPEIAAQSGTDSLTLYRIGDFVDISRGPMMSHTGLLGKCTVTALHPLPEAKSVSETIYRLQGVAIPAGFHLNHFAYGLIEKQGKKLNPAPWLGLKGEQEHEHDPSSEDSHTGHEFKSRAAALG